MSNTKEINYKAYFNKKLLNQIKQIIPDDTYGEFTTIVHDILLRRAYTFDLDDKTILEDAQKCRENIKTICFASEDKFSKKTVAGHIIISRKIVEINADCFKKNFNFNAIYETLTHEIYHGIGAKKTEKGVSYTGLQYFDENGKARGTIFNEIFNESAADLASFGRNERDLKNKYHLTIGYPSITFVAPLFAAVFGVSEKDIIKVGISSREEFYDFLSSKFPEQERENFCKKLDSLEFELERFRSIICKEKDCITSDDRDNLENYLVSFYNFVYDTLYAIMAYNKDINIINQKDFEYRRDCAATILDSVILKRNTLLKEGGKNRIRDRVNKESRFRLDRLLVARNYVSRVKADLTQGEKEAIYNVLISTYAKKTQKKPVNDYINSIKGERTIPNFVGAKNIDAVVYSRDPNHNFIRKSYEVRNFDKLRQFDNTKVNKTLKKLFLDFFREKQKDNVPEMVDEPKVAATKSDSEASDSLDNLQTVNPKQIALANQAENITDSEISNVEWIISEMLINEQMKGNTSLYARD